MACLCFRHLAAHYAYPFVFAPVVPGCPDSWAFRRFPVGGGGVRGVSGNICGYAAVHARYCQMVVTVVLLYR